MSSFLDSTGLSHLLEKIKDAVVSKTDTIAVTSINLDSAVVTTNSNQGLSETKKLNARSNIGLGGAATRGVTLSSSDITSSNTSLTQAKDVKAFVEDGFVAQESGKGLSSNDYTTTEKNKLAALEEIHSNGTYSNMTVGTASKLGTASVGNSSSPIYLNAGYPVSIGAVYTQQEVDALINNVSDFKYLVVQSLPTASASTMGSMYLYNGHRYVTTKNGNTYSWVDLGTYDVDLSGYVQTSELETELEDRPIFQLVTEEQMEAMIAQSSWETGVIYYTIEE